MAKLTGSLTYTEGGGEQTLFEMTISKATEIKSIWIDGTNLVAGCLAKLYVKLGSSGTTYVQVATRQIKGTFDAIDLLAFSSMDSCIGKPIAVDTTIKVTLDNLSA